CERGQGEFRRPEADAFGGASSSLFFSENPRRGTLQDGDTGGTAFSRGRLSWRVEIISLREEESLFSQMISNSTPRPGSNFSSCCSRVSFTMSVNSCSDMC